MSPMKERFPIFSKNKDWVYLDSAATTHKPKEMIDAISSFYANDYATVHRAIYRSSLKATEQYNATRETVKTFINAKHIEEIIFTRGTTDALNMIAQSLGLKELSSNDEILITEMEHHSNIVPWQMLSQRTKAKLRFIRVDDRGVLQWQGAISPRTKIVAVGHMSNATGTINPIQELAKEAHKVGALIVVDGAQAAPHIPLDVQALDVDFYAFSAHKCYGPTGLGILYGKKELLETMPPVVGGGDMIERVDLELSTYQAPPLRFEAGTPIIGSVIAFKSSLDFIEEIGREKIAAHEDALLQMAMQGVQSIDGLKIIGQAPNKGPILTFAFEDLHSLDVATFLDLDRIAVRSGHLCAQPILRRFGLETALRASFGVYNAKEDVERFLTSLQKVTQRLR